VISRETTGNALDICSMLMHFSFIYLCDGGSRGHDHMVVGFMTTYATVPITTNVVSSNPATAMSTQYNSM